MLWLLVILIIGGLLFVLLHKPQINSAGVGWIPPEQRQLPVAPPAVEPSAQLPGTFNYDPQAPSPRASTEQPHT